MEEIGMTKVYLFGARDIYSVPASVEEQLYSLLQQNKENIQFIVGDSQGSDSAFHKSLSAIGARRNSLVYCLGQPRTNEFELDTYKFNVSEYEGGSEQESGIVVSSSNTGDLMLFEGAKTDADFKYSMDYYKFRDNQMIKECDIAVCLWDTKCQFTFNLINTLKAVDKPVYIFNIVY